MKQINRDQYYIALGFFLAACQMQSEVRKLDQMMTKLIGETKVNDAIYDPTTVMSKDKFDELLLDAGLEVNWKDKKES